MLFRSAIGCCPVGNLFSKAQVEAVKNFQVEESFAAFADQYDFSSIADSIDDCSLRTAVGRNEYRNPELGGFAVLDGCSNRCDSAGSCDLHSARSLSQAGYLLAAASNASY